MTTNSALAGARPGGIKLGHTRFESELQVRPDDLDMFQELYAEGVRVDFEILKREKRKLACDGWFHYTLVSAHTGRAVAIPREIAERYAV